MSRFAILLLALTSTTALADPAADITDAVNRVRAAAGLPAVTLDPDLGDGCAKHTEYLRLNHGNRAIAGLRAHDEQLDLPGASNEGRACGQASDLASEQPDAAAPVAGFMAGIYHRRPLLDPGLEKIGFGAAQQTDGRYIVALRFAASDRKGATWPVRYPADGQRDIPLEGGGETPEPVHLPAGYPVTLMFPPFDKVTNVHGVLTDTAGDVVAVSASDPEHPATSFPQQGIVALIAKHPFAPDTTYHVSIDATRRGAASSGHGSGSSRRSRCARSTRRTAAR